MSYTKRRSIFAPGHVCLLLFTVAFLFSGTSALQAQVVVFDDSSSASAPDQGQIPISSLTWNHTVTAGGSDPAIVVALGIQSELLTQSRFPKSVISHPPVTSVTHGGFALVPMVSTDITT